MKLIGKTATRFLVEMDLVEIKKITGLSHDDAQILGNEVSISARYEKYIGTENIDVALTDARKSLREAIDKVDAAKAALIKPV